MEPVDFQHEQYTRALWFAEGVTSTASELMLVRAGLEDERAYLVHLSELISDFESHPARHSQSPEASSLEAWMEGHPYYRRPERSVSYYTSGEVLGVLLDLRLRALTHGTKSLRDLFQAMNKDFTKQGRFYDDARGVQQAAESVSGASLEDFFAGHVRGTRDIAYDEFFRCVGLKLKPVTIQVGDAGFDAVSTSLACRKSRRLLRRAPSRRRVSAWVTNSKRSTTANTLEIWAPTLAAVRLAKP
jgi:predicted metalloprotease with PDZ domain